MEGELDVRQGTLTLIGLKTLGVLGPQQGWCIARLFEQISGDILAVNQGTLCPLLLKLEHEGSSASEWGASEKQPPSALLSHYRERPQATAVRSARLGTNGPHHRNAFLIQSGGCVCDACGFTNCPTDRKPYDDAKYLDALRQRGSELVKEFC